MRAWWLMQKAFLHCAHRPIAWTPQPPISHPALTRHTLLALRNCCIVRWQSVR